MANIDQDKCIGCQVCVQKCPEGIEMQGGVATIKDPEASCLEAAASVCPVGAITVNQSGAQSTSSTGSGNSNTGRRASTGNQRGGGRKSGRGRGQGQGTGSGPGGYCVCPNCGYQQQHKRGVPCVEMQCPQCNSKMIRADRR